MNNRAKWFSMKPELMNLIRCSGVTYLQERCIRLKTHTYEGKQYCNLHYPPDMAKQQKLNKDPRCQGIKRVQ